jgi:hypothetical protein
MRCAIMQPTYFPWAGYFNLMHRVDAFVFLDDVQYEKGTWQNRNRVMVQGQAHWLTVPAPRAFLGQVIREVEIPGEHWRRKHLRLLEQAYARHPYAAQMLAAAAPLNDTGIDRLGELNIRIISALARALGISTRLLRASELGIEGGRTERLVRICERLECDEYLSPPGSADYLAEDGFTRQAAVRLSFNEYVPAPYPQAGAQAFVSHLSMLDVIANVGLEQAAAYACSGRELPLSTESS